MSLLLGLSVILVCTLSQCVIIALLLRWLRGLHSRQKFAVGYVHDTLLLCGVMMMLLAGNLFQVSIWAAVFVVAGEFAVFSTAFYFSLVNFTTLGYGDIIMSEDRALLGPVEAMNGVLMLGLSTSFLFATMASLLREHWKWSES